MSQRLPILNTDLEDENIFTTHKFKKIENKFSTTTSSISSNPYNIDNKYLPNNYLTSGNIEDIELAEFIISMAVLENNARQLYTNPVWQRININLLSSPYLTAEISNPVVNRIDYISIIDLINNLINRLQSLYIFSNSIEIIKYLSDKKYLIYFLLDANKKIKEVFPDEKLKLIIIYDPEITGWRKLIIDIHTLLDVDEAFDRLKMLDNSWWLDVSYTVGNDLNININFDEI
ncbi:MAG: hypothetical protein QNJ63_04815 [Calothrix sp. MO_192.B10]|nr:hypothetical protein [Calothrix sp. MO_192.B10]